MLSKIFTYFKPKERDPRWVVLNKYLKGRLVDEEDKPIIEYFQTIGMMKSYGIHCEVDAENETIELLPTCRTTDLGRRSMWVYE